MSGDSSQHSLKELEQAQEAIRRAQTTCALDERLRCIHNAKMHLSIAHNAIVAWKTGQEFSPPEETIDT